MKKVERDIIEYLLKENNWVSSEQILRFLNVSLRTLRSRVKEINAETQIIVSSKKGYCIPYKYKNIAKQKINDGNSIEDYNDLKRHDFIVKRLVFANKSIDMYSLAEELFISDSTLNSDLNSVRKILRKYDLSLVKNNDFISIEGKENKIRKLISDVVYNEAKEGLLSLNIISDTFPNYKVLELRKIIIEELAKCDLSTSDYNLLSIILHFCIIFERTKHTVSDLEYEDVVSYRKIKKDSNHFTVTMRIVEKIEKLLNISISEMEMLPFYSIISLYTRDASYHNITINDVNELVKPEILTFVKELCLHIYDNFFIDLKNDDFIKRFSLHLNELIVKRRKNSRNSLYKSIKESYPAIFELAVFMSKKIIERWPFLELNEHEISYIAIHIGVALENTESNKYSIAIVNPNYYCVNENMVKKIEQSFGSAVKYIHVFSDEMELNNEEYDIVLSTSDLNRKEYKILQTVSVFMNQGDLDKIQNCLRLAEYERGKNNHISLSNIISEEMTFVFEGKDLDRETIIKKLCSLLVDARVETEDYIESVLSREEASYTSFSNIAIPHGFKMNTKRTVIAIGLLKHPVKWGTNPVNIVFLLAVSPDKKAEFISILEDLIKIFTSSEWNRKYKTMNSFDKVCSFIQEQMKS